jgi:hypothetical protein
VHASEDCDVSLVLALYCGSTVSALMAKMYLVSTFLDYKEAGSTFKNCILSLHSVFMRFVFI